MIQQIARFKCFSTVIAIFLIAFIVLLDQFVKYRIRYSGGFYICNDGISFGLMLPRLILWFTFSVFIFLFFSYLYYIYKKGSISAISIFGLIFLISGAISNALDRAFTGCVLDYISPFWKTLPVFNIADIAIFVGTILLILNYFKKQTP